MSGPGTTAAGALVGLIVGGRCFVQELSGCLDLMVVGNLTIDVVLRGITALPEWGHEALATGRGEFVAGQAGYLAQAASKLGLKTGLVGVAGEDSAGTRIVGSLQSAGVCTEGVQLVAGARTDLTIAMVRADGERAFVSELSGSAALDANFVEQHWALVKRARVLALVGLFNLPRLDLTDAGRILSQARAHGMTTLLDTGWDPDGWPTETVRGVHDLLEHTDLFLPNREEIVALTGKKNAREAQNRLQAACAGSIVVKDGSRGSITRAGSRNLRVPAMPTRVVDTVGAGDVYDAGFLTGYLREGNIECGMRLGTAAASYYVARATDRFPTIADLADAADRTPISAKNPTRRLDD